MPMFDKLEPSLTPKKEKKSESTPSMTETEKGEVKGEKGTGFEKRIVNGVDKGPFECHNCSYMKEGCDQETMKKTSKQPHLANGQVEVDKRDCCEFIDRVGKKEEKGKSEKKEEKSEKK